MNQLPDPQSPSDEEIALCAYRIWLQEGCPHGRDREHWHKAREQLLREKAGENRQSPRQFPDPR